MTPEQMESMIDRLWALYSVEQLGNHYMRQLDRAGFMAIVHAPFEEFAPDFSARGWNTEFNIPQAKYAVAKFFYYFEGPLTGLPMTWQRPFREAFDRGEINGVALGAAVTRIYRAHYPRPSYRGEYHAETLANLRVADPIGMMSPRARKAWHALPDRVHIYRGALTRSPDEAAQGISWSLLRAGAFTHLHCRKTMVYGECDDGRVYESEELRPQLLYIIAPRSSIIAMHDSNDDEVFVDYEMLDPAKVTSLSTDDLGMQDGAPATKKSH